jgi:hypothetical protein
MKPQPEFELGRVRQLRAEVGQKPNWEWGEWGSRLITCPAFVARRSSFSV